MKTPTIISSVQNWLKLHWVKFYWLSFALMIFCCAIANSYELLWVLYTNFAFYTSIYVTNKRYNGAMLNTILGMLMAVNLAEDGRKLKKELHTYRLGCAIEQAGTFGAMGALLVFGFWIFATAILLPIGFIYWLFLEKRFPTWGRLLSIDK